MNIFHSLIATLAFCFASQSNAMDVSFEQDNTLPLVQINLAIRAGAVTDPKGQSGLTNFMGEMLLRGTRSRSKEQLDLALDQMGAKLEIETRAESMIIRGTVLASQLKNFLGLITEIVTQPSFPEREIKKFKNQIVSGLLEEQGTDQALESRDFQQFIFGTHPYGNPIMGRIKDVEAITRAKVLAHYDHYVHDQNLLVVGQGQVGRETIQTWADQIAEKLPTGSKPVIKPVEEPKNFAKRRLLIIDKPDRTQTQISVGQIGIKMSDPNYFPLHVGNFIFGGGSFNARLMKEIRVKRGWSYGAYSGFRFGTQPRYWRAHLFPASKDAAAALKETLKLISEVQTGNITQAEFDFSQSSLVNQSGFLYDTPAKRVENLLLEKTLNLPAGFIKSYGSNISKVTLAQTNEAMRSYLQPDKLVMTVLATAHDLKQSLSEAAQVPLDQVVIQPYTQD